jgi:hypothetical protein
VYQIIDGLTARSVISSTLDLAADFLEDVQQRLHQPDRRRQKCQESR